MGTFTTKKQRLRSRAKRRRQSLKNLNYVPPVKNVDVEEIKKSFSSSSKSNDTAPSADVAPESGEKKEAKEQAEDKE